MVLPILCGFPRLVFTFWRCDTTRSELGHITYTCIGRAEDKCSNIRRYLTLSIEISGKTEPRMGESATWYSNTVNYIYRGSSFLLDYVVLHLFLRRQLLFKLTLVVLLNSSFFSYYSCDHGTPSHTLLSDSRGGCCSCPSGVKSIYDYFSCCICLYWQLSI